MNLQNASPLSLHLIAVHPYFSQDPSHLSFPAGITIKAKTGQEGNSLWFGHHGNRQGWFPPGCCRLQRLAPELTTGQKSRRSKSYDQLNLAPPINASRRRATSADFDLRPPLLRASSTGSCSSEDLQQTDELKHELAAMVPVSQPMKRTTTVDLIMRSPLILSVDGGSCDENNRGTDGCSTTSSSRQSCSNKAQREASPGPHMMSTQPQMLLEPSAPHCSWPFDGNVVVPNKSVIDQELGKVDLSRSRSHESGGSSMGGLLFSRKRQRWFGGHHHHQPENKHTAPKSPSALGKAALVGAQDAVSSQGCAQAPLFCSATTAGSYLHCQQSLSQRL